MASDSSFEDSTPLCWNDMTQSCRYTENKTAISRLTSKQMKQKIYFGRSKTSLQASDVRYLNLPMKVISAVSSASSYCLAALRFGLWSRISQIRETEMIAMLTAGTQYYCGIVRLRVAEKSRTMRSSPRTRPSVAKLIMRPRDSDLI